MTSSLSRVSIQGTECLQKADEVATMILNLTAQRVAFQAIAQVRLSLSLPSSKTIFDMTRGATNEEERQRLATLLQHAGTNSMPTRDQMAQAVCSDFLASIDRRLRPPTNASPCESDDSDVCTADEINSFLEEGLTLSDEDKQSEALAAMSASFLKMGNVDEAIKIAKQIPNTHMPKKLNAFITIAESYVKADNVPAAIQTANAFARCGERSAILQQRDIVLQPIAVSLAKIGKLPAALQIVLAISTEENKESAWQDISTALVTMKKLDDAISVTQMMTAGDTKWSSFREIIDALCRIAQDTARE